jgi:transposase
MLHEIIELLDENLVYHDHQVHADHITIFVHSKRKSVLCPYCGYNSSRIHSRYERSFYDLPIQGKKVCFSLLNRKYLCLNPECRRKTFAERFDCIMPNSKKSERLQDVIAKIAIEVSSVTASKILSDGVVDISPSTISNLLQKKQ